MVRPSAEALHGFALLRLVLAMAVSLFGRDPQRGTAWLQYESSWSSKLGIPPLFRGNLHIVSYSNMISWYIMISCKPCKACVLNWNAYVWHIKKKLKYTYIKKKNINMRGHTHVMYHIWSCIAFGYVSNSFFSLVSLELIWRYKEAMGRSTGWCT